CGSKSADRAGQGLPLRRQALPQLHRLRQQRGTEPPKVSEAGSPAAGRCGAPCPRGKGRGDPGRKHTGRQSLRGGGGSGPASFSTSPGLLRVQPAVCFSAPAVTQASCRRAQSLLAVPSDPATGPDGRSSLLMPDTGPEELPG